MKINNDQYDRAYNVLRRAAHIKATRIQLNAEVSHSIPNTMGGRGDRRRLKIVEPISRASPMCSVTPTRAMLEL